MPKGRGRNLHGGAGRSSERVAGEVELSGAGVVKKFGENGGGFRGTLRGWVEGALRR